MSLHIGGKVEIAEKKILMILDYSQAASNQDTGCFLKKSESKKQKTGEKNKTVQEAKSIVVVEKDGEIGLYYSPISSVTLAGRCKNEWTE